jgi:ribosomal-protein-alanine N-acetyltransferase
MNGVKITRVSRADINRIYNIEKEVFKDNAFTKSLLNKLVKKSLYFLKLVRGLLGKILGFVIVIKDRADRANLINFLIFPDHQGKGLGALLLSNVIKLIKSQHPEIGKIVLNVKNSNQKAIKLYQKFGFQIKNKIENYYESGDDSFSMELDLNTNL